MTKKTPTTHTDNNAERDTLVALLGKLEAGDLSRDEQTMLRALLPTENSSFQVLQMAMLHEQYSGPVPHPELLNKYDPETRRIILQMAQDDQAHVQEMQRKGLNGAIGKDRRGQWLGFGIAMTGLITAAIVARFSPIVAGVIAALDLVGMVAVFVVPRAFEKFGPPRQKDNK